jgi:hypothetical protein
MARPSASECQAIKADVAAFCHTLPTIASQLGLSGDKRPRQVRRPQLATAGTGREGPDAELVANVLRHRRRDHLRSTARGVGVSVVLPLLPAGPGVDFCRQVSLSKRTLARSGESYTGPLGPGGCARSCRVYRCRSPRGRASSFSEDEP